MSKFQSNLPRMSRISAQARLRSKGQYTYAMEACYKIHTCDLGRLEGHVRMADTIEIGH